MATRLLRLSETDVHRLKNKKAIDVVIPILFAAVVEWGCQKPSGESFKEFLQKSVSGKWEKYEKRFNPHPAKLNEKDCSTFDVTFLLKLIPEVCAYIAPNGSPVWSTKDDSKLEWHLTLAKEIRNDVSHQPKGSAVDPMKLDEIEAVVIEALKVSGIKYNVIQLTVDQKIQNVRDEVEEIRQKDLTEREIRINYYENEFKFHCRIEIQNILKSAIIFLPFDHTKLLLKDIFHEINLTIQNEVNQGNSVSLSYLLQLATGCCIIVTGQPGTGKSTLLKRLREDFFEDTEPEIFPGVRKFPLMLYIECRDSSVENCAKLLAQHFPEMMKKVDNIDDAFVALRGLGMLICVDGLDEMNPTSQALVDEVIDKFVTGGKSTLIVTSRPNSVHDYMKKMEDKNISYLTATINLLTEKSQQRSYLMRYEKKLQGVMAPKLVEAFEHLNLDNSWKNHFSYPIYLTLFCCLYKKYPSHDDKLKSEVSIMEETLKLCKENVVDRLNTMRVVQRNPRTMASDLMDAANDLSLSLLNEDKLLIDERSYSKMCKKCFKDLPVSYSSVVSCLFLGQSDSEESFQYLHKSHAEFMAAKALFWRLASDPETKVFDVIALVTSRGFWSNEPSTVITEQLQKGGERVKAIAFLNVFRFVAILLVEAGGKDIALENFLDEICPVLVTEKVTYETWAEFTLSCGSSEIVAKAAANSAKKVSQAYGVHPAAWVVNSTRLMTAAAKMLPHYQPSKLIITVKTTSPNITPEQQSFMKIVGKWFAGVISFSHDYSHTNFLPVDDFLTPLWSARCQLSFFKGCLGMNVLAGQAFVNAVRRSGSLRQHDRLTVSLSHPRQHQLSTLDEAPRYFVVNVRLESAKPAARGPRPLPIFRRSPPLLSVRCTPDSTMSELTSLITDLAPRDKRYSCVRLQHWQGDDASLQEMLTTLDAAGLWTRWSSGAPSWESTSPGEDDDCNVCRETKHKKGERCIELRLRDKASRWYVSTADQMAELTKLLPYDQPVSLGIWPSVADVFPDELTPLLEVVKNCYTGRLDLHFKYSYEEFVPADKYLHILSSAKCKLDTFEACLGQSTEAWEILADAVRKAGEDGISTSLYLSLSEPRFHLLDTLGLKVKDVCVLLKPGSHRRCPLPIASHPINVTVQCRPPVTVEDAAALVEDIAPEGMRFCWLRFHHWSGSDADLDELIQKLAAAGVRTAASGMPKWTDCGMDSDGNCNSCNKNHSAGVRCILIDIPRTDNND